MRYDYERLAKIADNYGDSFYIIDEEQFKKNYAELDKELKSFYPKFQISYSYKTNYVPSLCKILNELGGYAEVVSDMEYKIALKSGVTTEHIIFNGPYKDFDAEVFALEHNSIVNVDNIPELQKIVSYVQKNEDRGYRIALRCNYDVADGNVSRFGFDTEGEDFQTALKLVAATPNLTLMGLHAHFASRALNVWQAKVGGMLELIKRLGMKFTYIDVGGGLYGKMADSLKRQFNDKIPTYSEYAKVISKPFYEFYKDTPDTDMPQIFVEPGSALVGDVMKFVTRVKSIKNVKGKNIATVLGSIYNINPTLNKKNPPIEVFKDDKKQQKYYEDLDFGGFTCIESDYLYRHYDGELSVDDFVVFGNAGSYSVVLKPPFILPNFPIISVDGNEEIKCVKRQETFDDVFRTYEF